MSKHTPGPWHIAGDSDGTMITANFAKQIALWPPQSGEIEQCANARLIAAAPEMLALLHDALKIVDAYRRVSGGDGDITAMNIRAIIKQATSA